MTARQASASEDARLRRTETASQTNTRRYDSNNTKLALVAQDISYIKDKLDDIQEQVSNTTVNQDQFQNLKTRVSLIEKVVYGFVGLILVSVIVAILALVLHTGNAPTIK